jgi:hypothetical protein
MIDCGLQEKFQWPNINREVYNLKGNISDIEAKRLLAKFISWNPGFAWEMLSGMELEAFQDFIIRGWMVKNFSMNIWSRGGSKTELAAVFCGLWPIIQPGAQVVIAAPTFRKSREILERFDKFSHHPKAALLRQCITEPLKRKNDMYSLKIGSGTLVSIPLNPAVRGFRSNCLFVDEMLLVGEEMYTSVLFPFLAARSGVQEALKIKNMEELLIRQGLMTQDERQLQTSLKKVILLSSAAYEFEFMFDLYNKWIDQLKDAKKRDDRIKGTYFVSQLGWEAIPDTIMDVSMVLQSKKDMSESTFNREYNAQFTKDSGSFFSMKLMELCTVKPGQLPRAELKTDGKSKYIVVVDTNLSASLTADHFGMAVLKIDYEAKKCYVVHNYARAGVGFKEPSRYFYYLMKFFNPVAVILDKGAGGWRFVEACMESALFKDDKFMLEEWKADFDSEDYSESLREAKRLYNVEAKRIVYLQNFSSATISKMNDNLQIFIEKQKVWFTSSLNRMEDAYQFAEKTLPPYIFEEGVEKHRFIEDLLDDQEDLMNGMKNETALIEVKTTPQGNRTFDLPQHLKRSDSPGRARRDSYSCLLMGCWMAKVLLDMADYKDEQATITPMFLG